MYKAKIDKDNNIICPDCNKSKYKVFKRDNVDTGIYLNRCKCENCGQLFNYKVDKKNNPIFSKK